MRMHLNTQQERPRVKCDCVFAPWHASGPSCVWCPSITGNLALCELIKVESICSNPIQLTPELLLTHPATRAKLPSPLRPMTRDNTGVLGGRCCIVGAVILIRALIVQRDHLFIDGLD